VAKGTGEPAGSMITTGPDGGGLEKSGRREFGGSNDIVPEVFFDMYSAGQWIDERALDG